MHRFPHGRAVLRAGTARRLGSRGRAVTVSSPVWSRCLWAGRAIGAGVAMDTSPKKATYVDREIAEVKPREPSHMRRPGATPRRPRRGRGDTHRPPLRSQRPERSAEPECGEPGRPRGGAGPWPRGRGPWRRPAGRFSGHLHTHAKLKPDPPAAPPHRSLAERSIRAQGAIRAPPSSRRPGRSPPQAAGPARGTYRPLLGCGASSGTSASSTAASSPLSGSYSSVASGRARSGAGW